MGRSVQYRDLVADANDRLPHLCALPVLVERIP
jgi:hypothetical protein